MLLEPLNLTAREREVAGLMVKGLTRPEIASALGISSETAKKHITNIVVKCGVSNQREAVSVIFMNDYVYGAAGIDADFLMLRRHVRFVIENDKSTNYMIADSEQVCCKDEVAEKEGSVFSEGEIVEVRINGEVAQPTRVERARQFFNSKFDPPVRRGQVIQRNVTSRLRGGLKFPDDYFFIEQPLPCRELKVGVSFGSKFRIGSVEFAAKLGTHGYEPDNDRRVVTEREIEWTIPFPKVLSDYTIRWHLTAY